MTNYTDPVIEAAVSNISREILDLVGIDISEFERSFIREALIFARTTTPNNYAHVLDDMEKLTRLESQFNYLIYTLIQYQESMSFDFASQYNPAFARLTRAGRPNQAAVEAEVLAKDDNSLLVIKQRLNRIEQLIAFLKSEVYIIRSKSKTFDAKRSNTF